jgi:hypothetical protein
LKTPEVHNRVEEVHDQGLEIGAIYDASGQSILITFDYGKLLE